MNTFGLNSSLHVVTTKDSGNVPTEFNNIINSYNSITQFVIYSHCENLWEKNSVAGLGSIPTVYCEAAPDDAEKQAMLYHQRLMSKILVLWIKNSLTIESKRKLRAFKTS